MDPRKKAFLRRFLGEPLGDRFRRAQLAGQAAFQHVVIAEDDVLRRTARNLRFELAAPTTTLAAGIEAEGSTSDGTRQIDGAFSAAAFEKRTNIRSSFTRNICDAGANFRLNIFRQTIERSFEARIFLGGDQQRGREAPATRVASTATEPFAIGFDGKDTGRDLFVDDGESRAQGYGRTSFSQRLQFAPPRGEGARCLGRRGPCIEAARTFRVN